MPHALAEPLAEDTAGADADHRLDGLVAGALCVAPRVDEAEEPRSAVRLEPDRDRPSRADDRRRRRRAGAPARPATSSIAPTITQIAITVPRSGSASTSAQNTASRIPIGFVSSPSVLGTGRFERYSATQTTTASFASSDGWNAVAADVDPTAGAVDALAADKREQQEAEAAEDEQRRGVP